MSEKTFKATCVTSDLHVRFSASAIEGSMTDEEINDLLSDGVDAEFDRNPPNRLISNADAFAKWARGVRDEKRAAEGEAS